MEFINILIKYMSEPLHDEITRRKAGFAEDSVIDDKPFKLSDYDGNYPQKINYRKLIFFSSVHFFGFYGLIRCFTSQGGFLVGIYTLFLSWFLTRIATMVSHRLFAHRAYKVTPNFKKVLLFLQTMTAQNSAYTWAKDHRLHHKYSDTNADPHNPTRGFWFSHIGWCVLERHPALIMAEKKVDVSDLENDYWVVMQYRYYLQLYFFVAIVIPVAIPYYLIYSDLWDCLLIAYFLRTVLVWNAVWTVNSVAHTYGNKPYNVGIHPTEINVISILNGGEGWHNFHHTFPFDYRTSEIRTNNDTTKFIELAARFGWAYDFRKASDDMIIKRSENFGDGSRVEHLKKYKPFINATHQL